MAEGETGLSSGLALTCDHDGVVTEVVSDPVGLSGRVGPGSPFASLVDEGCAEKAGAFLDAVRRQGAAFNWELVVRTSGGQLVPMHFAGGASREGFLVVGARSRAGVARAYEELVGAGHERADALRAKMKDLSSLSRRQAEHDAELYEELSALNNELAAAHRELARKNAQLLRMNEQKNQLLGIAAHDLRNPLQVILAYGDFLLDKAAHRLEPEHVGFIEAIIRSSGFMLNLVNDLLDISKIEAGKLGLDLTTADLAEVVGRNVALNRHLAERKEISILFDAPRGLPPARVDVPKVEQVLNNLIGNAVKFSPRGSRVRVSLDADGGFARVSVADEGPGIPADRLDTLFVPFARGGGAGTAGEKGTGLGLAIVKRIVEGHGGTIKVESGAGAGATFTVSLPLAQPAST